MADLRRSLGAGGPDSTTARGELRRLASDWPGALRELDTLDTDEIDRRAAACAACASDDDPGPSEPWMAWMARYHELMRAALALRRGELPSPSDDAGHADFAQSVAAPGHGRLNVVVFARLAEETGRPARALWDALFPRRGSARRRYRE